jgi:hypothetical protein
MIKTRTIFFILLFLVPLVSHAEVFEWPATKPNVVITNTTYGRPLTGKDTVRLQKGNYNYPRLEQINGGGSYFTLDCRYAIFIKTDQQWGQGLAIACTWVKIYGATVLERPEPLLRFTGNNIRYPSYIWFDSCTTIKSSLVSVDWTGGKPFNGDTTNMLNRLKITRYNAKGSYKDLGYWVMIGIGNPYAIGDNTYSRDVEITNCRFDSLNCEGGASMFIQLTQSFNATIANNIFSNLGVGANPKGHIACIGISLSKAFIYNNVFGPNNWGNDIRGDWGELKGIPQYAGAGRVYNNISFNKRKYAFIESRHFESPLPASVANTIGGISCPEVWNNLLYRPAVGGTASFYAQSAFIMDWYRRDGAFLKNNVLVGIADTTWSERYIGTLGLALWEARTAKHDTAANRMYKEINGVLQDAVKYIPVKGGPLHNKGVPVPSWLKTDFYGNPRVSGSAVDIGPVELQEVANKPPVISSVSGQIIILPVNTATVSVSAKDDDGFIASYQWTKVAGPAGSMIQTPSASQTIVSGLTAGDYYFEVTVTDNEGMISREKVLVSVIPAPKKLIKTVIMRFYDDLTVEIEQQ